MDSRGLNDEDGIPQVLEELARATTPASLKGVRACKRCGILKTLDQFMKEGCDNCPFLDMADDQEKCSACTTVFFEGHCAIMSPRESWVAKWLRTDNLTPGVYAITVTGKFDKDIEEELQSQGHRWRCQPPES